MDRESESQAPGIVWGLFLTLLFHAAFAVGSYYLLVALDPTPYQYLEVLDYLVPTFFIGVSQLVYMVPVVLIARARKARALCKGFLIGIILTLILNGVFIASITFG